MRKSEWYPSLEEHSWSNKIMKEQEENRIAWEAREYRVQESKL